MLFAKSADRIWDRPPDNVKILYLATACPSGCRSGAEVRSRQIATALAQLGNLRIVAAASTPWSQDQRNQCAAEFDVAHIIDLLPTGSTTSRDFLRRTFDPRFLNTNGVTIAPTDRDRLNDILDWADLVWIHTFHTANATGIYRWGRSVLDADDYPSRFHFLAAGRAKSITEVTRRIRLWITWLRRERLWKERFSRVVVCKESDMSHFGGAPRVVVIPNGYDSRDLVPRSPPSASLDLGMVGDFRFLPNRDGVRWFLQHVWPHILETLPSARLRLMGKASESFSSAELSVFGLGFVPDSFLEQSNWAAMIVPTRMGGGSHLKVAEGVARCIPIISTPHGMRGYTFQHGSDVIIAPNAPDMIRGCISVLGNPTYRADLAASAFKRYLREYSWQSITPKIASVALSTAQESMPN